MDGVIRIKYFPGYNQISLLDEKFLRTVLQRSDLVIERVRKYVGGVSTEQDGVILGASFTSTVGRLAYRSKIWRKRNLSLMVWPVYGTVDYKFKPEDIYVNIGEDPRVVLDSGGNFLAREGSANLFFTKNPFENLESYKNMESFLPDATGERSLVDALLPNKEIVRRWVEERNAIERKLKNR